MKVKSLLKTYYPAFLLFLILLSFSVFAFYQALEATSYRRSRLFEIQVQQAQEMIKNRMTDYIQILRGYQSLFYASDTVTANDWKTYTKNLKVSDNYPGIQGIGYAAYIHKAETTRIERTIRENGYPQFNIKSTFKNDFLTPIIYIQPLNSRNLRAFGYDMYSEANRKEAMDRAIVTGKAAMTKQRVILIQETGKDVQPGFLLYLPVYENGSKTTTPEERKRAIRGFVYNPFRAHDLMQAILNRFKDIQIVLYLGNNTDEENLLYNSLNTMNAGVSLNTPESELRANPTFTIAGAQLTMLITPQKEFGSSIERYQPIIILISGLSISLLLFIMALNITKRRSEIVEELKLTKQLENKKDEFIGIASHELKTPLTSVKAYMQLLERAKLKEPESIYVSKANANINKINTLISDLLDVTKMRAGKLQLRIAPFLLKDLIEDSIESVQHMYSSHEIKKPLFIPDVTIMGDKFRLEQALTNLLVNAVKYSPDANTVYVNAELLSTQEVRIDVKDEGVGISPEDQERIFDRFYRSEKLSRALSGLGVGLYISQEIIKQHNGTISVKSGDEKGSVFQIQLPVEHSS